MSATGMDGQDAIVFYVCRKQPPTYGYTWLIGWTTMSFYLKKLYMPLQSAKITSTGPTRTTLANNTSDSISQNPRSFRLR
jgi:hypothetical protein